MILNLFYCHAILDNSVTWKLVSNLKQWSYNREEKEVPDIKKKTGWVKTKQVTFVYRYIWFLFTYVKTISFVCRRKETAGPKKKTSLRQVVLF